MMCVPGFLHAESRSQDPYCGLFSAWFLWRQILSLRPIKHSVIYKRSKYSTMVCL